MSYTRAYAAQEPSRAAVDAAPGWQLLEFGAPWCPHCSAAQAPLKDWLEGRHNISHLKIEDGKGRPLGRSFQVRLWPTLVVLHDGQEVARVVRPRADADLAALVAATPTA
ncbi:MAG: thioredoxin family protein [Stenotrophomonas rhizophila]|uniref:thioredoxin family protein n=1 Tax=Stenotrophomonas rhizophila TaxID=216778 RepID=UPI003D0B6B62